MVIVARSRSIDGPWENMSTNPLLRCTDPAQPWWSRGHGTLLEGPGGSGTSSTTPTRTATPGSAARSSSNPSTGPRTAGRWPAAAT
ncbi:family 43 glycosylhydrolase [Actinomyces ruminis]|uniref:family 43 glycosylhydrolase n=1 Tax=Actinomyces ruminis TaxID=1937003 RepID=UPI003B848E24